MLKLSIITVNLNNNEGLRKTIDSVLNQTHKDFEHVIIDGGSTDGSVEVIKQYKNNRLKWISEKDHGIYNAMNKGIIKACGEYLLFINSGDFLYSDSTIEKIFKYNLIEDLIVGDLYIDYVSNKTNFIYSLMDKNIGKRFLSKNTLPHPSTLIKRKFLLNLSMYDESYRIAGDYDFFVRAITAKATIKHIPVVITVFNDMGVSRNNLDLVENENIIIRRKYYNVFYRMSYDIIDFVVSGKNFIVKLIS